MEEASFPKLPEGVYLTRKDLVRISQTMIDKFNSLMAQNLERDLDSIDNLDLFDQCVLHTKWDKWGDYLFSAYESWKKYESEAGRLELFAQKYGEQLDLPASSLVVDIEQRLDWYKKRIAKRFEAALKAQVGQHGITSPIEQIFVMEWKFQQIDERFGVTLTPQMAVATESGEFRIDFAVRSANTPDLKLGIEIDGHAFHEKTKEQVAKDKARERAIAREGYVLLRFTGHEIFHNPRKCVGEVIEFLQRRAAQGQAGSAP